MDKLPKNFTSTKDTYYAALTFSENVHFKILLLTLIEKFSRMCDFCLITADRPVVLCQCMYDLAPFLLNRLNKYEVMYRTLQIAPFSGEAPSCSATEKIAVLTQLSFPLHCNWGGPPNLHQRDIPPVPSPLQVQTIPFYGDIQLSLYMGIFLKIATLQPMEKVQILPFLCKRAKPQRVTWCKLSFGKWKVR